MLDNNNKTVIKTLEPSTLQVIKELEERTKFIDLKGNLVERVKKLQLSHDDLKKDLLELNANVSNNFSQIKEQSLENVTHIERILDEVKSCNLNTRTENESVFNDVTIHPEAVNNEDKISISSEVQHRYTVLDNNLMNQQNEVLEKVENIMAVCSHNNKVSLDNIQNSQLPVLLGNTFIEVINAVNAPSHDTITRVKSILAEFKEFTNNRLLEHSNEIKSQKFDFREIQYRSLPNLLHCSSNYSTNSILGISSLLSKQVEAKKSSDVIAMAEQSFDNDTLPRRFGRLGYSYLREATTLAYGKLSIKEKLIDFKKNSHTSD